MIEAHHDGHHKASIRENEHFILSFGCDLHEFEKIIQEYKGAGHSIKRYENESDFGKLSYH